MCTVLLNSSLKPLGDYDNWCFKLSADIAVVDSYRAVQRPASNRHHRERPPSPWQCIFTTKQGLQLTVFRDNKSESCPMHIPYSPKFVASAFSFLSRKTVPSSVMCDSRGGRPGFLVP